MIVILMTSFDHLRDMELNAAVAALTCHANTDKKFEPRKVLERIIKAGHESVLEHITVTYSVKRLSRACLQELARHRHISLSVESTRYTLKRIFDTWESSDDVPDLPENVRDFEGYGLYRTLRHYYLSILRVLSTEDKVPNDDLKYYLPELWPTNLVLTSNVRELRHIVKLRSAPAALKEFQELAQKLVSVLPEDLRYLVEDCVQ